MSSHPQTPVSREEYLERERSAEYKSEYFAGEVFAMTGASRPHNLIVANLIAELQRQLRGRACEVYPSDMRVHVAATGLYTYPDVVVVCGTPVLEDQYKDTLLNPTVLIEVLSPSTEAYDRGRKAEHYRRLDSLEEYLLVAQDAPRVEEYRRHGERQWILTDTRDLDETIELTSIGATLTLRDIYDRIF